jgi:hypothetical protein
MGFITKKSALFALAVACSLALAACAPRSVMVREFVDIIEQGLPAIEQEDDLHLLAKSMPAHIKLLETLLASDPGNEKLLVLLARLYGGYAFAILESELEALRLKRPSVVETGIAPGLLDDAAGRYFQRGAQYALRSLENRYPQARSQLNQLITAEAFIRSTEAEDVPALFWYGFNLGGFVQHRLDSVEAMAKAHLVEKTMDRVVELNEAYHHGDAYLALLVYHASRAPMMGGNPEKARKYFQRHAEMNNGVPSLGTVYWARYILVRQQDREAFVQSLSTVVQIRERDRSARLLDRVAAVRAQLYLDAADRFFD